ncbi:MAG TPA: hypothetical protein VHU18_05975 [Rhizomicrobium sp.]|nr:hypothetical protein [Rhizomicrobium sp.]
MQKGYARAAGIAAGFKEGPGLNVTVSRLLRDKKIIAAISEELVHYDAALGWRGRARMAELAESGDEDVAFKASKALLEMTGNFVKRSEVKVMHELEALSTEELERRIAEAEARVLAQREAERLRLTPPLDAEFTVIESGGPSHR